MTCRNPLGYQRVPVTTLRYCEMRTPGLFVTRFGNSREA